MNITLEGFRQKTDKLFQPIDSMTASEIEEYVSETIRSIIEKENIPVTIGEVILYGSRCRGLENENSDIDFLVEYQGDYAEYALFNTLYENRFCIEDKVVDLNPVEIGSTLEHLQQAEEYLGKKK